MTVQKIAEPQEVAAVKEDRSIWRVLQAYMRKKRFNLFKGLLASLPRPLCILDVGGTQDFWEQMEFNDENVKVIVSNLTKVDISYPGIISVAGDAREMPEYTEKQFDIVFSNSVIEHVGTYEQQGMMACEVQRVGLRYYLQTPNRYFPIEPHVLLPFFQFLPFGLRVFILSHFMSPWGWKIGSKAEAIEYLSMIRLLSEKELRALFTGATIYKEKFLGLTKSFVVYKGWS